MIRSLLHILALFLAVVCVSWWVFAGMNPGWTKTSVATMETDEVTGIEYPVWKKQFVPGVDFLGAGLAGAVVVFGTGLLPVFRKPQNKTKQL
jgi:hypothetical protein